MAKELVELTIPMMIESSMIETAKTLLATDFGWAPGGDKTKVEAIQDGVKAFLKAKYKSLRGKQGNVAYEAAANGEME